MTSTELEVKNPDKQVAMKTLASVHARQTSLEGIVINVNQSTMDFLKMIHSVVSHAIVTLEGRMIITVM